MRRHLLAALLLLASLTHALAQRAEVKGHVRDTAGKALPAATILVQQVHDSSFVTYALTDGNGAYRVEIPAGIREFTIKASSLGFQTQQLRLTLPSGEEGKLERAFVLTAQPQSISEVVVRATRPVAVSGDTVTFNAAAYSDRTEQVVEDLLKKLPGVEVARDGRISVNGKPIRKILVEGDDLLDKNYRLISKNLSADLIDKVQVLDRYTDNPLLKGLEKSEDKALNLVLREDRKNVIFGDVSAGYGNDGRHDGLANVMSFSKGLKVYGLGSVNNIGKDPIAYGNSYSYTPSSALSGEFSPTVQGPGLISGGNVRVPYLDQVRTNLNAARFGSVNFIHKPSAKLSVKGNGRLYGDRNTQKQEGLLRYLLPGDTLLIRQSNTVARKSSLADAKVDIDYDVNGKSRLSYSLELGKGHESTRSEIGVDGTHIASDLVDRPSSQSQRLDYTYRIDARNALVVSAASLVASTPQMLTLEPGLYQDAFDTEYAYLSLGQGSEERRRFNGAEAKYLMERGSQTYAFRLGANVQASTLWSDILLKPETGEALQAGPLFSNRMEYRTRHVYGNAATLRKIGKVEASGALTLHAVEGRLRDRAGTLQRNLLCLEPRAKLVWSAHRGGKLTLGYSFQSELPDAKNLNRGYILSDYRTFSNAIPALEPLNTHSLTVGYAYTNWYSQYTAYSNVVYGLSGGNFTNELSIGRDYTMRTRVSTAGRMGSLIWNAGFDKLLPPISSTLKLSTSLFWSDSKNRINAGDLRDVLLFTSQYKASLVSAFPGAFNFNASAEYAYVRNRVSANGQGSQSTENSHFRSQAGLSCLLPRRTSLQLTVEQYYFGGVSGAGRHPHFLDATLRHEALEKKLSLRLVGNNLLGSRGISFANVSDYMNVSRTFRLRGRYFLMEAKYQF